MANIMQMFQNANPFAASARLFDQAVLCGRLPMGDPGRAGVCRGVCLAYAGLTKLGTGFGGAAGLTSSTQAKAAGYQHALAQYAAKLQREVEIGTATTLLDALSETIARNGKVVGLNVLKSECRARTWPCAKEIADDTIRRTSPGKFFLIMLPNHWICTRQDDSGMAYVFDPNYGETKAPCAAFQSVCGLLLTHRTVTADYNLVGGAKIHVIVVQ